MAVWRSIWAFRSPKQKPQHSPWRANRASNVSAGYGRTLELTALSRRKLLHVLVGYTFTGPGGFDGTVLLDDTVPFVPIREVVVADAVIPAAPRPVPC
jgi:hypothetical protein